MEAAVLAIVGTLLGASLTFLFQRLSASRAEEVAREERLRERRIEAYSNFAEKLMEWRRSQVIRSSMPLSAVRVPTPEADGIRDENRRARAAAWTAFYQVKLLVDDTELEGTARSAGDVTRETKRAKTKNEINNAGDLVRERLEIFPVRAARQVVPGDD